MDWLLNLIPGGGLTAILGAVLAGLAALGTLLYKTKKSGVDQQKAKEAVKRDQNLDRIKRASDAKPAGSVSDDPNNRDRLNR